MGCCAASQRQLPGTTFLQKRPTSEKPAENAAGEIPPAQESPFFIRTVQPGTLF
jgi:hypothetical protein